jgi:branched-chain amino acid transport system permease protein
VARAHCEPHGNGPQLHGSGIFVVLLAQLLVNGVAAGGIYALLAIGFALIYNTTRIFHLAHASVYTFGAYAYFVLSAWIGLGPWVSAPFAVLFAALFGMAIELAVYRPVRRAGGGSSAILIATLGTMSLCQALFELVFSTDTKSLREGPLPGFSAGDLTISILHIAILIVVLLAFPALQWFLKSSRIGTAIRALAENPPLAQVQGIDTERLYLIIFLLGSALAGVAAVFTSLDLGVRPEMGFDIIFIAIVAVVIGGVGYLPGALAGAFALGIVQQLAVWKLNSVWQGALVFTILLVFLLVRPHGFFGGRAVMRQA